MWENSILSFSLCLVLKKCGKKNREEKEKKVKKKKDL